MPRVKAEPFADLTPIKRAILFDNKLPRDGSRYIFEMDAEPGSDPYLALWEAHRTAVLDAWVKERRGTRPRLWWRYDAPRWNAPKQYQGYWFVSELPEPRLRIGGIGVADFEEFPAIAPRWRFGIPDRWHMTDADDPPIFESQIAYLKRHNLLLDGEAARLPDDAFDPEAVGGD